MEASVLEAIETSLPGRSTQIHQLNALFLDPLLPSPPTLVVHGLEGTGKTTILRELLASSQISYTWIPCNECITARQLTERIADECLSTLGLPPSASETTDPTTLQSENANSLAVLLQFLLKGREEKFVLVLDEIDAPREAPVTFMPAMGRLGDMVPGLTVVFVLRTPRPRFLHSADVPHVHFPPYTGQEAVAILEREYPGFQRPQAENGDGEEEAEEGEENGEPTTEERQLWSQFLEFVWESLAKSAGRDLMQFRVTARKLWPPFIAPVEEGKLTVRNIAGLLLSSKQLFRDEGWIVDSVIPFEETRGASEEARWATVGIIHDLPVFSKWLLCAAYLASYNPSRLDTLYFMKAHERRRKKKGGGTAKPGHSRLKHRKIPRRLLGPQAFPLERLLAIFRAIYQASGANNAASGSVLASTDISCQIATLASLRLVTRSAGAAGDPLDGGGKWRVNVGWDYVRRVARSVKFEIEEFLEE